MIGCFYDSGALEYDVFEFEMLPQTNDSVIVTENPQLKDLPVLRLNKSVKLTVARTVVKTRSILVLNISEYINNEVLFWTGEATKFAIIEKIDVD